MSFFIGSILIVAVPILLGAIFFPDSPVSRVYYPLSPHRIQLTARPLAELLQETAAGNRGGAGCHRATQRVVLALSASFERSVKPTIQSLLQQSCPVDAFYIFVHSSSGGADSSEAIVAEVKSMSDIIILKKMPYRSSNLLAALQEERDPKTWIITVEDDVVYHRDMVRALVVAARTLPSRVAPAFSCAETFVQFSSLGYSFLPVGSPEGTVHGWCYSFGGILFKRWFFDDQVFITTDPEYSVPDACSKTDDVWAAGHLLSKGNQQFYLVNPGFKSFGDKEVQGRSSKAKYQETQCASWFAAFWGVFADMKPGSYRHPHFPGREKDLKMLSILDVEANGGSFVESLVEDVKAHSSSLGYFLEKEFGWRGVLIQPKMEQTSQTASSVLASAICGQADKLRTWFEVVENNDSNVPGLAAFEDTLDKEFVRLMDFTQTPRRTSVRCQTLQDILQQADMSKVSLLALDSTWNATEIFSSFPFQDHEIHAIYVEVKRSKCRFLTDLTAPYRAWSWSCEKVFDQALQELMAANGYSLYDTILVDIGGLPNLAQKQFFFHYAHEVTLGMFFRPPKEKMDTNDEVISLCDGTCEMDQVAA